MTIRTRILLSVLSLFFVSLTMLAGTLIVTNSQEGDGLAINLSGRQRMLSQKIAKDTLAFEISKDAGYKDRVSSSIRIFDKTLNALANGGNAPLTLEASGPVATLSAPDKSVASQLSQVASLWKDYKKQVDASLSGNTEATATLPAASDKLVGAMTKAVSLMQASAEGKVQYLLILELACAAFGAAVLLIVLLGLRRDLFTPLGNLRAYSQKIAGGKLDAQPEGSYAHELHFLKDDIDKMVTNLKAKMAEADALGREANQRAEETAKALQDAEEQRKTVQKLFDTMTAVANKAQGVSHKVFASVEELSRQIEVVNNGVDIQRDRMTETATAMEEMNGTVFEVAQNASSAAQSAARSKENAETGAKGVRKAVDSIEQIQQRIMSLKETMGQLGQQADSISQIMVTISDIADQTNLLALNAAIEAARAGEAGRGFAVVADEVRKLAEKTMHATKEVGDAVKLIQTHARENVQAVEMAAKDIVISTEAATESGRFMEEIVHIVDETAMQVSSIATASEEQSAASEEINRAVSEVTRVASETAEGMSVSAKALVEISGLVEELDTVIQSLASGKATGVDTNGNGDLFTWTDDLALNIKSIDDQHKRLVQLINSLHRAMKERRSKEHLIKIVDELKNYTVTHFKFEEDLFAKHRYPETPDHIRQHEKFVEKVLDFEEGLKSGKLTVTMDVMRFLKEWLMKHINGTDRRYTPFLREKGVR
ncbi:bacteriohemerythrin [Desulfovibrio mangrovi]|uniref:bacteriohemerythrin n=1 Tax=Desulfovibrio mangrovi TaxID=2976983 RepID=UPI002248694E|nr:bacteriohemerythrin [Desulfovibrio mangrovi]UZP67265.1 bacteriohemerythrin [Desulfovibrio mangrovi]